MMDDGSGAGVSPATPGVLPANGTPTSVGRGPVPEPARALPDKSGVPSGPGTPTSVGCDCAGETPAPLGFAGGTPAPLWAGRLKSAFLTAGGTHCPTRLWTLDFGLWTPD